jgi:hypothetical protein
MRIAPDQLAATMKGLLLQSKASGETVIGVFDTPIDALVQALGEIESLPKVTLFLTQRCEVPATVTLCCERLQMPSLPLPGRIGGFLLCRGQAIFHLHGTWFHAAGDDDIVRQLTAIGDRVVRLTTEIDEGM